MGWDTTLPVEGTNIVNFPGISTANWTAIASGFGEEHYSFASSASSGLHIKGVAGVIKIGTSTEVTGTSTPPTGALGWDTTTGVARAYTGSTWAIVNSSYTTSRVMAYRGTSQSVSYAPTTPIAIQIGSEIVDSLGEFNTSTYYFTPKDNGIFLVTGKIALTALNSTDYAVISILSGGALTSYYNLQYGNSFGDLIHLHIGCLIRLTPSNTIGLGLSHTCTTGVTVSGGSTATYLHIHRVC